MGLTISDIRDMLTEYHRKPSYFKLIAKDEMDDGVGYCVCCGETIYQWLEQNFTRHSQWDYWVDQEDGLNSGAVMDEATYLMLQLRWS